MSNILLLIVVFQFIKKTCSFLPIDRKMIWWYIFISIITVVQEAVHTVIVCFTDGFFELMTVPTVPVFFQVRRKCPI